MLEPRKLVWSRVELTPENDGWDTEVTTSPTSFVLPLAETLEFNLDQQIQEAPVYKGDIQPHQVVDMQFTAELSPTLAMEFVTLGRIAALFHGANGMVKPEGATGKLFEFFPPSIVGSGPKSTQATGQNLESTAQYERLAGLVPHGLTFPFMVAGQARYTVDFMGSGTYYETNHPGGAAADDEADVASYFNYAAYVNGQVAEYLTNFTNKHTQQADRMDVGTRQGRAGAVVTGSHRATGEIGMMHAKDGTGVEVNRTLEDLWKNKTIFPIECIYTDLPGELATQYFRTRYYVRISKPKKSYGGEGVSIQNATWQMVRGTLAQPTDWAAELIGDNKGPFTVPAASNIGIKIDNGATTTIAITAGARTVDQLVTEINANGTFSAIGIADNFYGWLRIRSKSKGTASKVQLDGTVSNSIHTLVGMSTTAYFGRRCSYIWNLRNNYGAAY